MSLYIYSDGCHVVEKLSQQQEVVLSAGAGGHLPGQGELLRNLRVQQFQHLRLHQIRCGAAGEPRGVKFIADGLTDAGCPVPVQQGLGLQNGAFVHAVFLLHLQFDLVGAGVENGAAVLGAVELDLEGWTPGPAYVQMPNMAQIISFCKTVSNS